ncbi:EAL domain-containing protein [Candidatus Synechococcus calcipolaris G9]|uniref:EAL domain-containing protein n=1 Tax=Candidatus Synechococcus calcipolaris G9 TaxID=1497997 RepID=A0ABT6F3K7_9SYNE|nr:EAL domain-containing protein [Candidatus Synechococcus calcipolaris]MDG2992362.1 EAL domain-containing protein [Candidatus Synechococcus calcipolaris G9]
MTIPEERIRHLLVIQDEQGRRTVSLDSGTYSLGRHPSNTIVVHSQMVSRQHAMLLRVLDPESGNYFFRLIDGDLQGKRSVNGTTVNGKACTSCILKHRDLIIFAGDVRARYHAVSNLSDSAFSRYTKAAQLSSSPVASKSLPFETSGLSVADIKKLSDVQLLRLSSFPELSPNPILELDPSGKLTYLNPAAVAEFPEISQGDPVHPLLKDLEQWTQSPNRCFFIREIEAGDRIYEQTIHCLPESDLVRCYIVDITHRKKIEQALRESEERYAIAARGANDGLWDWNLLDDKIYYSPRWAAMIGYEPGSLADVPEDWLQRIHPDDQNRVNLEIEEHLSGLRPHLECEFRLKHRDGGYRWMRSRGQALRDENGIPYRMAGSMTDITEYRLIQEQILHDALHDAMTGLPNRILIMDRIGQALNRCYRRPNYIFAVLFLDVDRFKVINDSLGHLSGDQLLIGMAQRLQTCLRSEDTVARLGGDEFAILLDDISSTDFAVQVSERILKALSRPFLIDGHEVFATTSIGIALKNPDTRTPEDLIRDADTAMYRAKSLGKSRYEVFSTAMRVETLAMMQLETELRRAMERKEFRVYYQPIVDLKTEIIVGFETLLRWQHPQRGIIAPGEFMAIAEETGLIVPISWWVMEQACLQMQEWKGSFPHSDHLSISVNLTGRHFQQPDLLDKLQVILEKTGFPNHRLRLEVTESILIENTDVAIAALQEIRQLGIKLYMDDFGTGYSSLSYLHKFPIDTLKIDRCFIEHLDSEDTRANIVPTIITLAKSMGLEVVAEGIETLGQLLNLQALNCTYGQGYYFARPLSRERVILMLEQNSLTAQAGLLSSL